MLLQIRQAIFCNLSLTGEEWEFSDLLKQMKEIARKNDLSKAEDKAEE